MSIEISTFYDFEDELTVNPNFSSSIRVLITSCGKNYWIYTSTLLESIVSKKKIDDKIEFLLFVSNTNKRFVRRTINKYRQFNDIFFHVFYFDNYIKNNKEKCISTPFAFRFYIFKKNFRSFQKIIYLDSDIIVNGDLQDLYSFDIGEKFLGVVKDPYLQNYCNIDNFWSSENTVNIELKKEFYNSTTEINKFFKNKLEIDFKNYFNSGVLLIDLKKCEEIDVYDKFLNEKKEKFIFIDQDYLNLVFEDRVFFLEDKWNFLSVFSSNNIFRDELKIFSNNQFEKLLETEKNPSIIHYAGNKPSILKKHFKNYGEDSIYFPFKKHIEKVYKHFAFCIFFMQLNSKIRTLLAKPIRFSLNLIKRIIFRLKSLFRFFVNKTRNILINLIKKVWYRNLFKWIKKNINNKNEVNDNKPQKDLIFLDTQNAIGDTLSLIPFLRLLNSLGNLEKEIDVVATKDMKDIIELFDWKESIRFIYKPYTCGKHYSYEKFFKRLKIFKKLFLWLKDENYSYVYFLFPWISIDSMAIMLGLNKKTHFIKPKFIDYYTRNYFYDIVPIPDHKVAEEFINHTLKQFTFFNIDTEKFWKMNASEIAWSIWQKINGHKDKDKNIGDFSFLQTNKLLSKNNTLRIVFSINRPEEKTIKTDFIIYLLNDLKKKQEIFVTFTGTQNALDTFKKYKNIIDFKYENLICKTKNTIDLLNVIKKNDLVFAIDSSIMHLANLLKIPTVLFVNSSSWTFKFLFSYWCKTFNKSLKLILDAEFFDYGNPSNFQNISWTISEICKEVLNFYNSKDNNKDKCLFFNRIGELYNKGNS